MGFNRVLTSQCIPSLAVAVFYWYDAAGMAAQMRSQEPRPEWEVPAFAGLHLLSLVGLYFVSVYRLLLYRTNRVSPGLNCLIPR